MTLLGVMTLKDLQRLLSLSPAHLPWPGGVFVDVPVSLTPDIDPGLPTTPMPSELCHGTSPMVRPVGFDPITVAPTVADNTKTLEAASGFEPEYGALQAPA